MTNELPVTRSMNYFFLALQMLFLICLYIGFRYSGSDEAGLWAAMIYLVIAYGTRYFVPRDHHKGMREFEQGNYEQALKYFEKSYEYFSAHTMIDNFRAITMFSTSKFSYREMAMMYKYSCLEALGRTEEYYKEF